MAMLDMFNLSDIEGSGPSDLDTDTEDYISNASDSSYLEDDKSGLVQHRQSNCLCARNCLVINIGVLLHPIIFLNIRSKYMRDI